jgi:hypothetical protein
MFDNKQFAGKNISIHFRFVKFIESMGGALIVVF